MCPASASWAENPGDALSHGGGGSAAAAGGGSTPDADAPGVASEDKAPDYPPARVLLTVPLDSDPFIEDDGGLPDWLIVSALNWVMDDMRQSLRTEWDVEPNCDTDEEE